MRHVIILILLACLALPAAAKTNDRSLVVPYPVEGKTAAEIYESIKKVSPRVAANSTFAFTFMATKTDRKEKLSEGRCTYTRFRTSVVYSFVLPKLRPDKARPKSVTALWQPFAAYLKTHEEGHRTIWRDCFAEYDAKSLELEAKTCRALDQKRERLFTSIKRKCMAKDEAYDFTFRKEVRKQPFVVEALKE